MVAVSMSVMMDEDEAIEQFANNLDNERSDSTAERYIGCVEQWRAYLSERDVSMFEAFSVSW